MNWFSNENITLIISSISVLISSVVLLRSIISDRKTEKIELLLLQQRVVLESERVKSAWYAINNEIILLRINLQNNKLVTLTQKKTVYEFIEVFSEFINNCILDANAMAEDVYLNSGSFDQKKCEDYLKIIEISLEKVNRNKGVLKSRVEALINK